MVGKSFTKIGGLIMQHLMRTSCKEKTQKENSADCWWGGDADFSIIRHSNLIHMEFRSSKHIDILLVIVIILTLASSHSGNAT